MWQDGWGAGGWLMMSVLMVAFWTLLVVGVLWLMRVTRPVPSTTTGNDARRLLDERFARGEITEDEYRSRRDVLASR